MPTLSERLMKVALLGVVPDDDQHVIADANAEIERLRAAHQDIIRKYEKIMGDPPYWTTFAGSELKLVREAWYGAASISRKALADEQSSRPIKCEGCDTGIADPPSRLCPGCQAYVDHQR